MSNKQEGFSVVEILSLILVIIVISIFGLYTWHHRKSAKNKTIATTAHIRTTKQDALVDADSYLTLLETCNLNAADMYRLDHSGDIDASTNKCKAYCPSGFSYILVNQKEIVSQSDPSGSNDINKTDEIAYIVSCSDKKQPVTLNLIYSSSQNIWKIVNPYSDPRDMNSIRNWLTSEF